MAPDVTKLAVRSSKLAARGSQFAVRSSEAAAAQRSRRARESEWEPSAAAERDSAERHALGVGPQRDRERWGPTRSDKGRQETARKTACQPWPAVVLWLIVAAAPVVAQPELPQLTRPVNDFAGVVDASSAAEMDRRIRALQAATGDTVVVATVRTFKPYGSIEEYAVKLFENGGRGIGERAGATACCWSPPSTTARSD